MDSKGTDIALEISDGFVGVKLFLRAGGWRSAGGAAGLGVGLALGVWALSWCLAGSAF